MHVRGLSVRFGIVHPPEARQLTDAVRHSEMNAALVARGWALLTARSVTARAARLRDGSGRGVSWLG